MAQFLGVGIAPTEDGEIVVVLLAPDDSGEMTEHQLTAGQARAVGQHLVEAAGVVAALEAMVAELHTAGLITDVEKLAAVLDATCTRLQGQRRAATLQPSA